VVTIYAFSIENFKRSKFEVDALMDIAKVKLSQLAQHGDLLDRYGASVRILGRRGLLKPDVAAAVDQAVELTSRNGDRILNICFPYTSRDEITTAIRDSVIDYTKPLDPVRPTSSPPRNPSNIRARALNTKGESSDSENTSGSSSRDEEESLGQDRPANTVYESTSSFSSSTTLHLAGFQDDGAARDLPVTKPADTSTPSFASPETITPQTLTHHMFTKGNPPLDLLIRTSGVERLSDFMLWQCHQNTEIVFLDVLWPEFDLWHFLPVLWRWQRRVAKAQRRGTEEDDIVGAMDGLYSEGLDESHLRQGAKVKSI
jgi:ditrans,polycis-polyprenyl diphosphate synthase